MIQKILQKAQRIRRRRYDKRLQRERWLWYLGRAFALAAAIRTQQEHMNKKVRTVSRRRVNATALFFFKNHAKVRREPLTKGVVMISIEIIGYERSEARRLYVAMCGAVEGWSEDTEGSLRDRITYVRPNSMVTSPILAVDDKENAKPFLRVSSAQEEDLYLVREILVEMPEPLVIQFVHLHSTVRTKT